MKELRQYRRILVRVSMDWLRFKATDVPKEAQ